MLNLILVVVVAVVVGIDLNEKVGNDAIEGTIVVVTMQAPGDKVSTMIGNF